MQIAHPDSEVFHVIGEILRHPFRERRDQYLIMIFNFLIDFTDQIIDLSLDRTHVHIRIQQTGRAYDLFRAEQFMFLLILAGRRRDEHDLINSLLKFREVERTVIEGTRKAESVVDQCHLSASVTVIHGTDLRNCHMRLVHDNKEIIPKIINQSIRRLAFLPAR